MMEEIKRGISKENLKKLFSFNKEDIFWIIFFFFLFGTCLSYYTEINRCKASLSNPCYLKCQSGCEIDKYIAITKAEHPDWMINCDYDINSPTFGQCDISGMEGVPRLNMSYNLTGILNLNDTDG